MSDKQAVRPDPLEVENRSTPEGVAMQLLEMVMSIDGKVHPDAGGTGDDVMTREWLLDAFAECLNTVRNPEGRLFTARKAGRIG